MSAFTHAPLTTPIRPLRGMLEKQASSVVGNVPDDVEKWGAHVLSELQRNFPFLGRYDVSINIDKVDAEAGYGAGYAMVRNFSSRNQPQTEIGATQNYVRVPILIRERKLLKPKVFELGGQFYALNKQRVGQAMSDTQIFDGSAKAPRHTTSLIDDMFPPYQQRQGFGRIFDASASGLGKIASAADMLKVAAARRAEIAELQHTKEALGVLAMKGSYFGDKEWIDQFEGTPFFTDAQKLIVKDAENSAESAKRRAARAAERVAEAHLEIEGAELSAKLAVYKHQHNGVEESKTLNKLSEACGSRGWSKEFAGTPYYESALHYLAKEAHMALRRAQSEFAEVDDS